MPLHFREDRATQAAARLLKLRGGRMSYMKLIKLLYLADRRALAETGRPITFDRYYSLPKGPILSRTLNLIVDEERPGREPSYWRQIISEPRGFDVELVDGAPNGALSRAQESIIDAVFAEYGHRNRWDLVEMMHELPEWEDPGDSSIPIELHNVLIGTGLPEEDAKAIEEEILAEDTLQRLIA
jgi:uncharacterized phage-associated protein